MGRLSPAAARVAAVVCLLAVFSVAAARDIRPWPENPRYWEYGGKPLLLLGGSVDDDLFHIPWYEAHLDTLTACGGNVIRCVMASSDSTRPWPFARTADGRYDLNGFDPEFWNRFEGLLKAARAREVVVQIEIWATFNYYRESWTLFNPYNPALNVNYGEKESGLSTVNESHPTRADNPFFRTVPEHENNEVVLKYQRRFVDRLLSISLEYDNVLYAMDNETSVDPRWGACWSEYVKEKAAGRGKTVYTTEMWDPWDLRHEWHLHTIDHPETYGFIDISQNNWQEGQRHQDALAYVRDRISDNPRPINNTKVYARRGGAAEWVDTRLVLERFWGNVWGGCASTRFHRPTDRAHGIGLNENAQRAIRGIREVMSNFDIFNSTVADNLLLDRSENEAYCLAGEESRWAVWFPDGGAVLLRTEGAPSGASFRVRWFDCAFLEWTGPEQSLRPEGHLPLAAPGGGMWVALVERQD